MKQRFYTKSEIARMYFPGLSSKQATQNLRRWIMASAELSERLEADGASCHRKTYSCHQVTMIFDHFGHP